MTTLLRVLLVEDSDSDAELTVRALERGGYELMFDRVDEPDAMRDALDARRWDLIITDWSMPRFSALGALAIARDKAAEVPVIVVSGTVGEETAIEALHAGAHDFVIKGKLTRLVPAVQRELRELEARSRTETALRKAEEQLRQAQKMEAVGQLAGGIARSRSHPAPSPARCARPSARDGRAVARDVEHAAGTEARSHGSAHGS